MMQMEYFTDTAAFTTTMFDPTKIVQDVWIANDQMVSVSYKNIDDYVQVASNTNPIIAAFTTCHARLKLYTYLEPLGKRVLYFDTGTFCK
jgi:hypothetical protein